MLFCVKNKNVLFASFSYLVIYIHTRIHEIYARKLHAYNCSRNMVRLNTSKTHQSEKWKQQWENSVEIVTVSRECWSSVVKCSSLMLAKESIYFWNWHRKCQQLMFICWKVEENEENTFWNVLNLRWNFRSCWSRRNNVFCCYIYDIKIS